MREYQQREQDELDYRLSLEAREARGEDRGRREGRAEGMIKGFASLIRDGLLTVRDAALRANMTEADFTAQMAALGV